MAQTHPRMDGKKADALRSLDRKQDEHHERDKDDERIQPVLHGASRELGGLGMFWLVLCPMSRASRFDVMYEFMSTKQDRLEVLFGQALMVSSEHNGSLRCAYEFLDWET